MQDCAVRPVAVAAGRGPVQGPLLSGPWTSRSLCLLKRSPFAQKKLASGMWERQSYTRSRGRTARVHGPRGRAVDAAVLPSSLCRIVYIHAHTHTYTHKYIHTYTHTHLATNAHPLPVNCSIQKNYMVPQKLHNSKTVRTTCSLLYDNIIILCPILKRL